ncbi:MAG: L-serine ammonia-lyase [Chitinispirillaceae bacterium]|nr:L-serine ammonia-lyase [Chitinispirillaceae bacterium]
MESLKELYRIGNGPSSSHTIGPQRAALLFASKYPDEKKYRVTLFGSLAATGRGHWTDKAIIAAMRPIRTEITWKPRVFLPEHPNGMRFEAIDHTAKVKGTWTVYSTGGGAISDCSSKGRKKSCYPLSSMSAILRWTERTGASLWEYVESVEGKPLFEYLRDVWGVMKKAIARGLDQEGVLPGPLKLRRKASSYFLKVHNFSGSLKDKSLIYSYALAVAEENAAGGLIVTAPTCGSSGVLPAVLKMLQDSNRFTDQKIVHALATAGLFGTLVKAKASISGADVGCQGEIGTACAMASAAATQLLGGTPSQVEYAAEMGMEHHLGLTCDPIAGLVQIPCIERNAFAAIQALNTATYALLSDGRHIVSFDKIVTAMNRTGHDLPRIYKETSQGGLAAIGIERETKKNRARRARFEKQQHNT